jgi:cysteinyl-tRNA synthetase
MSKKVLNHPDREDIISKLLEGDSVKSVEAWLKKKYPRTKRLHVSYMTLQKFRGENLNLKGNLLDDIKNKRTEVDREALDAETKLVIASSSAYQQKIDEIATSELDVARRLLEMDKVIGSRIEHYYNLLDTGGGSIREDKVFIEYINTMKSLMQDWKKYVEGVADTRIDHNININIVNEQAKMLKEVVLGILQDISPELVGVFVSRLDHKIRALDANNIKLIEGDIIDVY